VPEAGFSCKKKDINADEEFLHHLSSTFTEFSSSLRLEYGRIQGQNNDIF